MPQAMVTGTSAGTDSVNDADSARILKTASRASKKARASAAACSVVIFNGLLTMAAPITVLPSALRASAGTCGRRAGLASCAARKTALT